MTDSPASGLPLLGQVAFVAGGSGGIGGALAHGLAAAGADVAITYHHGVDRAREVVQGIEALGRRAALIQVDVRQRDEVNQAVATAVDALGAIDILVTALGAGIQGFFMNLDEDQWETVWQTDLRGVFYVCRAALGPMIERQSGRVIFLSSESAKTGNSGGSISSAARGGLNSFTKSLAREMARSKITVNAVCPGPTRTPELERRLSEAEGHMKYWDRVVGNIPLKRVAEPHEVASLVVYLASPGAAFITGQAISVSGGLTMS